MRKTLLLAFLICIFEPLLAQITPFLVTGGSGLNDEPTSVIRSSDNFTYQTGYYNQIASFGGTTLPFSGADDGYISKLSEGGQYLWTRNISGVGSDKIAAVREGADGFIYVAGSYTNSTTFGSITLSAPGQNVFVAKIDPANGDPVWFRSYGGSGTENLTGLSLQNDGTIYIAGQFIGNAQFGTFNFVSQDFYNSGTQGYDVYLAKLNPLGNVLSCIRLNSPDNDLCSGLDSDAQGNAYLSLLAGGASLNLSSGGSFSLNNSYGGVLLKVNSNFGFVFGERFNAGFIDIRSLDVYGSKVALGGDFTGTLSSSLSGFSPVTTEYENGIFGIVLDTSGTFQTYFEESSSNNLSLNCISVNVDGNIWIGGNFYCAFNSLSDHYGEIFFNNIRYQDAFYGTSQNNDLLYAQHLGGKGTDDVLAMYSAQDAMPTLVGSFETYLYMRGVDGCTNCGTASNLSSADYCGEENFYNLHYRQSIGSKDVFCATNIDTSISIFSFYFNPGCDFEIPEPQISNSQDTVYTCSSVTLSINNGVLALFNNSGGSYITDRFYRYQWKRNGMNVGTGQTLTVNVTGLYTLQSFTNDNCKSYHDTIYVVVLEDISNPTIWVQGATIYPTINSFSGCQYQIPKHGDSTIVVNGTQYNEDDTYVWTYTTGGNQVIATDTSAVSVSLGGNYTYNVASTSGCSGQSCFNVWNYYWYNLGGVLVPIGGGGPPGGNNNDGYFILDTEEKTDTITLCSNGNMTFGIDVGLYFVVNADTFEINIPAFAHWDVNGSNVVFPYWAQTSPVHSFIDHRMEFGVFATGLVNVEMSLLAPWQNVDTLFKINRNFYFVVHQEQELNITFNSSTDDLCPGDTLLLGFELEQDYPFSVTTNTGFAIQGLENTYGFDFPGTLSVYTAGTDPNGCPVSQSFSYSVVYKSAPPIFSNPANARKCPEDSVLLSAVDGLSAEWIGPEGTSIGDDFFIYVVAPGEYYYNLVDYDGCSLLSSTKEVRNIQAVIYDSIITTNICGGEAALVLLAPDTNLVYQWFPPFFGNDTIKYISQPGNYAVQVALCSNTDTLRFTIHEGLENTGLAVNSVPPYLCENSQLELGANALASEYLWFPGAETTETITITNPGYYRVVVSDTFGCVLSDSILVQQFPNPAPPDSIITPEACPGSPVTLSVNSIHQFKWHALPDTLFLESGNEYIADIQTNGQSFGGYLQNPTTGCVSTWVQTEAVLLTLTNIAEIPDEILYCPTDTVVFEPAQATGIAGGYWLGPNQFSLNQNDLLIQNMSLAQEGIYTYAAISAPGFCTYDTAEVYLRPRFLNFSQVAYEDTLCRNQTLQFQTSELSGYSYSWAGPLALSWNASDWTLPGVTPENTGQYYLTAREGNCIRTDTFIVFVSEIPPQTPIIEAITHICDGDTLFLFNADSLNTTNSVVSWSGSDLFQYNSPNAVFIPDFQSDNLANYALQYGINQCLSSLTYFSPQFIELPVFEFEKDTVEFCEGESIVLNAPQESPYYQWNTGSQQSSTTVYESGDLVLTLIDQYGCHFSDTVFVIALNCELDDTPNAFSPNGDGYNDVLNFKVSGGVLYHARIFDRWGKMIIDFGGDTEYSWDGNNSSGEQVDDGTYFYLLQVKLVNGEIKDVQGTVNVFR